MASRAAGNITQRHLSPDTGREQVEPEVFKLSPAVSLSFCTDTSLQSWLQHSANLHTAPGYHNQKNDLHEQLEEVQVLKCCDGITHSTNYDADYYY